PTSRSTSSAPRSPRLTSSSPRDPWTRCAQPESCASRDATTGFRTATWSSSESGARSPLERIPGRLEHLPEQAPEPDQDGRNRDQEKESHAALNGAGALF